MDHNKKRDKLDFRIDAELASAAREKARRSNIPLSAAIRNLLTEWVHAEQHEIRRMARPDGYRGVRQYLPASKSLPSAQPLQDDGEPAGQQEVATPDSTHPARDAGHG